MRNRIQAICAAVLAIPYQAKRTRRQCNYGEHQSVVDMTKLPMRSGLQRRLCTG
jgi:hypothetical protein